MIQTFNFPKELKAVFNSFFCIVKTSDESKIKNFHRELSPNACDIFNSKISNRKFWKHKPLTKNHKIKDLAF